MKKAHVFKYSQVILTEKRLSIAKFSDYSGLTIQAIAAIAVNEEKPNGVIDQYKTGKLTTEEFRTEMNELIKNSGGKAITDDKIFDNCWNSMCIVEPEGVTKLYNLQQKYDFHIHIISGTNELQHTYIQEKIQQTSCKINISYTLSYELGTLNNFQLQHYSENILKAQDYEPVWHMDQQQGYEQNALKILGDYYDGIMTNN